MKSEIWKQIKNFPKYQVSDHGRIKSVKCTLKPQSNSMGYFRVNLYNGKTMKSCSVASLVLEHFLGPRPSAKHEAAHINGKKTDNIVSNLDWKTRLENEHDKSIHGTKAVGSGHGLSKLTEADVIYIKANYEKYNLRRSNAKILAKQFGVWPETINSIIRGRTWSEALEKCSPIKESK